MLKPLLALLAAFLILPLMVVGNCTEGIEPHGSQEQNTLSDVELQEEFTAAQLEFFESKVRPLLVEHCYDCHGPDVDEPEGGLSLASRKAILAGGDSGSGIDLEDLANSNILTAVEYGDLFEMPPDSKLSDEDVAIFRKWVMDRAPWPANSDHAAKAGEVFDIAKRKSEHWCWQPISRPQVPLVKNSDWPRDAIDHFILQKLEQAELQPAAAADKAMWLRRVTFDLTGLPPTLEEMDAFLSDDSEQAFETVVDRLLDSPRYGERWARHWMDLMRFAETCGHEFDYPIPNAYRYRDYLIRAFNEDVSYDQFLTEHIAGDLMESPRLHPETLTNESVLGTGFWFFGEATHGPVDVKGDEAGRVDNQIDVFGKTFLGLTIACARCHDHKFDAISAEDYYGIAGFLQSSRRQNVMLDPHQKISRAAELARQENTKVSNEFKKFVSNLDVSEMYFESYPMYIEAAVEYLQGHDDWKEQTAIKVEGENLEVVGKTAGNPRPQEIRGWSGNKQLWWTDAKPGDSLDIGFPIEESNRYQVVVRLTTASDYGIVQLAINGKRTGEPIDLFSKRVNRTKEVALGDFDFEKGRQSLTLNITGANEEAQQSFMAGIDYITLTKKPKLEGKVESEARLEQLSRQYEVNPDVLQRWINAIKDPALKNPNHSAHLLRLAAESNIDLRSQAGDDFFRGYYKRVASQIEANRLWDEQPEFGEFHMHDGFDQWFISGQAFSAFEPVPQKSVNAVVTEHWLAEGAPLHSGILGPRFHGVARSPTFEIKSEAIQLLVSAKNARIRLVIDGFLMGEYNGLLFNDTIKKVDTGGQWRWIEMRGDIKKYLGHQAYLEFIDESDGYVAVKQIRFRNEKRPNGLRINERSLNHHGAAEDRWNELKSKQKLDPLQIVSNSVASTARVANFVPNKALKIESSMFDWMVRHRLIPIEVEHYEDFGKSLDARRSSVKRINDQTPRPEYAVGMTDGTPETEFVFIRGNHKNLGDRAARAPITALRDATDWQSNNSSSQRLQLSHHMTDPNHPLVRRVIVNRIWHHLTGRGLVRSVDNFGVLGEKPSHPQLLDYLSNEFSDGGWSIKKLVKRIVLTETYRMSSSSTEYASTKDPENILLYKFRIRRLQGESIRDSMLAVSGRLDTKMFGPSVPIHLTSFMQGRGRPGKSGPLDGNGRRSIYIEVRRNFLSPMMLAFDTPIPFASIGRRNQSNVPAQALIMMNDPFVIEQAEIWAASLIKGYANSEERLKAAVRISTGREVNSDEIKQLQAFIESQKQTYDGQADEQKLWSDVCHVLFNLKEFIYVK